MSDEDEDTYTPLPPLSTRNVVATGLMTAFTIIAVVAMIMFGLVRASDNTVERERAKFEQCANAENVGYCLYRAQGYR